MALDAQLLFRNALFTAALWRGYALRHGRRHSVFCGICFKQKGVSCLVTLRLLYHQTSLRVPCARKTAKNDVPAALRGTAVSPFDGGTSGAWAASLGVRRAAVYVGGSDVMRNERVRASLSLLAAAAAAARLLREENHTRAAGGRKTAGMLSALWRRLPASNNAR